MTCFFISYFFFPCLQHMVMSFRVTELQVLLGYAGRNKSGRKHELQARALSLLKNNCSTPVQIKIKDLYRRRFPRRLVAPPPYLSSASEQQTKLPSHSLNSSSLYSQQQQHGHSQAQHSPPSSGHHHTSSHGLSHSSHNSHSSHSSSSHGGSQSNLHTSSHGTSHSSSTHSSVSPLGSSVHATQAYHPDVKLKILPFFDILAELVKPSALSKFLWRLRSWIPSLTMKNYGLLVDISEKIHSVNKDQNGL